MDTFLNIFLESPEGFLAVFSSLYTDTNNFDPKGQSINAIVFAVLCSLISQLTFGFSRMHNVRFLEKEFLVSSLTISGLTWLLASVVLYLILEVTIGTDFMSVVRICFYVLPATMLTSTLLILITARVAAGILYFVAKNNKSDAAKLRYKIIDGNYFLYICAGALLNGILVALLLSNITGNLLISVMSSIIVAALVTFMNFTNLVILCVGDESPSERAQWRGFAR